MTTDQAKAILEHLPIETAADARGAILDIARGRSEFTEEEFSRDEYLEQLEAAHFLARNLSE